MELQRKRLRMIQRFKQNLIFQIGFLFVLFHVFWLVFYVLSDAPFIKNLQVHTYVKMFLINSLGFVIFCLSAYLLFPRLIASKNKLLILIVGLALVIGFGYGQYALQDWFPEPFFRKPVEIPVGSSAIKQIVVKQMVGSQIRAMMNMLVYVLLGFGYGYMKDWFIKDRRTRILEQEKIRAELTLLRYQLNPHFLFNTINNIYYLALIKSDKTVDAILKVAELLRYVLDQKDDMVPLDLELEHMQKLIKLQEFRFPDQQIDIDIEGQSEARHFQIAPLLLTTFAENAFKHGQPGSAEDPLKIKLHLRNGVLEYEVINRIDDNQQKDKTSGIGLQNLRKRLQLLYQGKHELVLNEENHCFKAYLKLKLT